MEDWPPLHRSVVTIEKVTFDSPSTKFANFTLLRYIGRLTELAKQYTVGDASDLSISHFKQKWSIFYKKFTCSSIQILSSFERYFFRLVSGAKNTGFGCFV